MRSFATCASLSTFCLPLNLFSCAGIICHVMARRRPAVRLGPAPCTCVVCVRVWRQGRNAVGVWHHRATVRGPLTVRPLWKEQEPAGMAAETCERVKPWSQGEGRCVSVCVCVCERGLTESQARSSGWMLKMSCMFFPIFTSTNGSPVWRVCVALLSK